MAYLFAFRIPDLARGWYDIVNGSGNVQGLDVYDARVNIQMCL